MMLGAISLCPIASKLQFCLVSRQDNIAISVRSDIVNCSPDMTLHHSLTGLSSILGSYDTKSPHILECYLLMLTVTGKTQLCSNKIIPNPRKPQISHLQDSHTVTSKRACHFIKIKCRCNICSFVKSLRNKVLARISMSIDIKYI